jgi:hypothetical protein
MNTTKNFISDTNIYFIDGISKGFSMLSDFLKYSKSFISNNKVSVEENYEDSFENLVSSFNLLNSTLYSYKKCYKIVN